MNCPDCGAEVASDSAFCPHCGARLKEPAAPEPKPGTEPKPHAEPTAAERFREAAAARQIPDVDPEKSVWSGTYSMKDMIGTWILGGVVTVGLAVGLFLTLPMATAAMWLAISAVVLWLILGLLGLYRRYSVYYELTSQRFIHKQGIFSRIADRIEVIDIDDVTYRQGLVQRMMNVGTITIVSSDRTHPELIMYGIEDVARVAGLIDDLRRNERRRRGLHIEAI